MSDAALRRVRGPAKDYACVGPRSGEPMPAEGTTEGEATER